MPKNPSRKRIEQLSRVPRHGAIPAYVTLAGGIVWLFFLHPEHLDAVVGVFLFFLGVRGIEEQFTIRPMAREIRRLRERLERSEAGTEVAAAAR